MAHYIDKDALVAEIKRLKEEDYPCDSFEENTGYYNALDEIATFLDNLEVKEMDLDKEIDNIWNPRFNLGWDEKSLLGMNHVGFKTIAKHFFELGLKAQKVDIVMDE